MKVNSVQGMAAAGVNERSYLNQVSKSGFDYSFEPELKKIVAE